MLYFIIDGYNLVNKIDSVKPLSLEGKRNALISLLKGFKSNISPRNKITVVFDGNTGIYSDMPKDTGVKVLFSDNQDADTLIKRLVDKAINAKEIVLVTDDKEIITYCKRKGVQHKDTLSFLSWIKEKRPASGKKSFKASLRDVDKINKELKEIWKRKYS